MSRVIELPSLAAALVLVALVAAAGVPADASAAPARAEIAKVVVPTAATASPGAGRKVLRLRPTALIAGGPNQLLIVGRRSVGGREFLKVRLPVRPNGATGWVNRDAVVILRARYSIRVRLGSRRVEVLRGGRVVRRIGAVVGKPSTPTPTGSFAISEIVPQRGNGGFYGPFVLTLTAFSNVLEKFDGGPGRVAIHGRGGASLRDPLGSARSHGCIRVDNGQALWLARNIEPGTPVTITR